MKKIVLIGILLTLVAVGYWLFMPLDYYEYDAQSAAECSPGEEFDAEHGVCYFDFYCETEAECAAVDVRFGQVLDDLALEYENSEHAYHEHGIGTDSEYKEHGMQNVFAETEASGVPLEQIRAGAFVLQGTEKEKITSIMQVLVPEKQLARIGQIVADSDGLEGVLAYVEPISKDGSKWKMAYDPADSFSADGDLKNPKDLLTTLIHEYGHVLALNDTQVQFVSIEDTVRVSCGPGEVILDEGCGKQDAYLTAFIKTFWTPEERDLGHLALIQGDEEAYSFALYNKKPDSFVTEYAATNETEDFAESFALFVMQSNKPSPDLIKNQKVLSFYQYPELVQLRNHMRGGLLRVLEAK